MNKLLAFLLLLGVSILPAQRIDSLRQVIYATDQAESDVLNACAALTMEFFAGPMDSLDKYVTLYQTLAGETGKDAYRGQSIMIQGIYLAIQGDSTEALDLLKKGAELCIKSGVGDTAAAYYYSAGLKYSGRAQFGFARKVYQQGIEVAEKVGSNRWLCRHWSGLAYTFLYEGNRRDAAPGLKKSLKIAESIHDTAVMLSVLGPLGGVYSTTGDMETSLKYDLQALELAEGIGDERYIVGGMLNIANKYAYQGDYEKALSYYRSALVKAEEGVDENPGLKEPMGIILKNIGVIYADQGDPTRAIEYFERTLDLAEEIGDKKLSLNVIVPLVGTYLEEDQDSLAQNLIVEGLVMAREIGQKGQVARLMSGNAAIYRRQEKYDLAEQAAREALNIVRELGDTLRLSQNLAELSEIELARKNYVSARNYAQQALDISQEKQFLFQIRRAAQQLWEIQDILGEHKAALETYQLYIQTRDSIDREENQRATIKFEYQQQALQDSLAFIEQQAQTELTYERRLAQRNYLLIGGLGLALLAILGFYFWQQRRLREKEIIHQKELLSSTILTQEKERQRIAKDLHDSVGSKLSVINLVLHGIGKKAPGVQEDLQEMLGVVGETINTTRRISHDLLPPTLESFGLGTAVKELCDQLSQAQVPELQVEQEGERPDSIDPLVELNLFRVLQELLTNTIKYAKADSVHIRLVHAQDKLILQYEDDGKGFDPGDPNNQKGLGMQNIQSRLQMIGGKMDLQSAPGQGIRVQMEVGMGEPPTA